MQYDLWVKQLLEANGLWNRLWKQIDSSSIFPKRYVNIMHQLWRCFHIQWYHVCLKCQLNGLVLRKLPELANGKEAWSCCSLRGRRVRRDKASEPPGIEPVTSAEEAQRPNLSIAREFPTLILFKSQSTFVRLFLFFEPLFWSYSPVLVSLLSVILQHLMLFWEKFVIFLYLKYLPWRRRG